jgi:small subunit ribosomal protein S1
MSEDQEPVEMSGEEDFAAMLEQSMVKRQKLSPGQMVEAKIVKITGEWVFLDLGGKGEGYLDKKEVVDESGSLTVKEGDTIRAYYLSPKDNDLLFTTKVGSGPGVRNQLEDAYRGGAPVEGALVKEMKGGFEVRIGTARAFCPFSLAGFRRDEDKAAYIGQTFKFMITEYGENGRNVVVSRRPILEEERRIRKEELKETLKEGNRVTGTVTSLQKFGAFVNIGGIEGLLPISELSYARVGKVSDVLSVGQQIEVVIKKMDWENERFSFSLKDILTDPWERVEEKFPVGSFHPGTVNKLMPFGAFVNLSEGIDGLIHISKLGGGKRISHPKEVVKEGQQVEVKIEAVDRQSRRISLALAEITRAEEEAAASLKEFKAKQSDAPKSLGSFGDVLKAQMDKKNQ